MMAFHKIWHRWRVWLVVGLLFGLFIIALIAVTSAAHGWAEFFVETQRNALPHTEKIGDAETPGLQGETWVEPTPVTLKDSVHWYFQLNNSSDREIVIELRELQTQSFDPPNEATTFKVHSSPTKSTPWQTWRMPLSAGERHLVWLPIEPQKSGAQTLHATLAWQADENSPEQMFEIVLPKVPVIDPTWTIVAHSVKCFVSLLGILAVPFLLAGAGFWFQQRQQHLSHEREAWANMLPKSHENNSEYYVPLLGTIKTLKPLWKRHKENDPEVDLAETTFYLLFTMRRLRHIFNKGVGVQLKSRLGEDIVTLCINLFLQQTRERLEPVADASALLDEMELDESLSSHLKKVNSEDSPSGVQKIRDRVKDWIASEPDAGFDCLFLAYHVLDFEMNRIYKFWYGTEPDFPPKPAEKDEPSLEERVGQIVEKNEAARKLADMWEIYRTTGLKEGWFKP